MNAKKDKLILSRIVNAGRERKISRRHFLQHATSAGLGVSAASALWTSEVSAMTPRRGGKFRVGIHDGATTETFNPAQYITNHQIQQAHASRSYLTEITSDNKLGPDMADGWSASPDAKTWTFELNKEASFHDGRPFTSRDVVATLNHHRGENSTSAAKAIISAITDVRPDSDHTVVIELEQGLADLPWILTDYHLAIMPADANGNADWESGVGAGPYQIIDAEPGIGTLLRRHDGWHREGAYFDEIEMSVLNDPNARQTALVAGDIDAVTMIDLKTFNRLQSLQNIVVENIPSASAVTLPMLSSVSPFDNVDVTMALKLSIDRDDIIEKILFGTGTVGNDFHVAPNMPYWPGDIEQRKYDPDRAKYHLKKAGLERLDIELSAADSIMSGAVDFATLYREHAKPAGIDIKPVREPNDGYWSNVWQKKPFVFSKWGVRPTPDAIFTTGYLGGAPWNESLWKNDRFDELLLQAKAELNDTLRAEMYREMCLIARDEGNTVLPAFTNLVCARHKNVAHNGSLASNFELDGARAHHRWWFTT